MEKMVTDPEVKKVILICDQHYAEKADKRKGGVGTETQIITPEIYSRQDQNKFVAIIAKRDESGQPYLPVFYKSRIYIDLSDTENYALNFDQLLRWIYDKPLYVKPDIGKKPVFLEETDNIQLSTTSRFNRVIDAIKNYRANIQPLLRDYLSTFAKELEQFRINKKEGAFDDQVIRNIEQFIPYRNEIINLFVAIAQYSNTKESYQMLARYFEDLIPYLDRPEGVHTWMEYDFDNFKFIIHELFLFMIASFLKYEAFDAVAFLLQNPYLIKKSGEYSKNTLSHFSIFRPYLKSLEERNTRLNLRRLSIHADLLDQRSKGSGFSFEEIMQADFILYLRDGIDAIRTKSHFNWYPITLLYATEGRASFEIFARSQTKEYFNLIAPILGIKSKEDFQIFWNGIKEGQIYVPRWEYHSISPHELMGYELLATR